MQQAPQETDDIERSRRPRWFKSEEQEMQFSDREFPGLENRAHVPRSKSTSRSRSRTRSRSGLRPTNSGKKPLPAPKIHQTHPKYRAVLGQQPAELPACVVIKALYKDASADSTDGSACGLRDMETACGGYFQQ
ncbi:hypothetical protein MTO96_040388 [Rhipicephalus appendiculatus]